MGSKDDTKYGSSYRPSTIIITTSISDVTFSINRSTAIIVLLFILQTCRLASNSQSTTRSLEYCDTEVLRAECADDHVIMMERATYGRMRLGRCVEIEMGHIGCFTDVIKMADRRCSGRRVCELRVPDAEFESTEPCLKELKSYLEASYVCVKLESRDKECSIEGENQGPVGHISNEVNGDGGVPCPVTDQSWVIFGKPGQHIRLILYDFSIPDEPRTTAYEEDSFFRQTTPRKSEERKCRQYGSVYDNERDETEMICGSHAERMSHIYTSTGHSVKLYLQATHPSYRFLIRFSVEGCPWPVLPEGARLQNKSLNVVFIGCTFSNSSWKVTCSGGAWEGFTDVVCPKFAFTTTPTSAKPPGDPPNHPPTGYLSPEFSRVSKLQTKQQLELQRIFQPNHGGYDDDDDRFVEFAGLLATTITAVIAIVILLILIIKVSRETSQKHGSNDVMKRNSLNIKENLQREVTWAKEPSPNFDQNENQRLLTNIKAEQEIPSAV